MTIAPSLKSIDITLPKNMIYSRILLGTDRLQANDSNDMKSDLQKLATNIISNYSQSIIQKISTSGVKSDYARTDMGLSDTFSYRDIERKNWSKEDFIKEYMFKPNASPLRKIEQTRAYFSPINSNEAIKPIATVDTKFTNLNDYAYEKTLKTAYGDVELFLDLYGDNDKLGIGKLEVNAFLFNFDSNKDGIINYSDEHFDKLKVRGYDKEGNEKILKLSDVVSEIRLDDFIKKDIKNTSFESMDFASQNTVDYRVSLNNSNPYNMFNPESRYQKIDRSDTKKFFDTYANKDGWVDLRNNNIFNKDSGFNNFAYEKVGFDGKLKLSEFNPIIESDTPKDKDFSYTGYQRSSFMKFYNDYNKELDAHTKDIEWLSKNLKDYNVENSDELISKLKDSKSSYMLAMENEFKKATGLEFSISNLEKVKRAFESDSNKAALALSDSDSVIAMRMNSNGTITLKFDSGREIDVRDLYTDTGKLNTSGDKRASINLEAKNMSKEELNSLDFETIAIKQDDKFVSLKELGATAISKIMKNNELRFLIHLADNNIISSNELYNISYLNHTLNSNYKQIQEKDRFYKRVDVRV